MPSPRAALEVMVKTWATELDNTAVRANLINPGGTRTRMRAQAFPGEDPATLPEPEQVAEAFIPLAEASCTLNGDVIRARDTAESSDTGDAQSSSGT